MEVYVPKKVPETSRSSSSGSTRATKGGSSPEFYPVKRGVPKIFLDSDTSEQASLATAHVRKVLRQNLSPSSGHYDGSLPKSTKKEDLETKINRLGSSSRPSKPHHPKPRLFSLKSTDTSVETSGEFWRPPGNRENRTYNPYKYKDYP